MCTPTTRCRQISHGTFTHAFLSFMPNFMKNIVAANIIVSPLYSCFIELLHLCFLILNAIVLPLVCLTHVYFISNSDLWLK